MHSLVTLCLKNRDGLDWMWMCVNGMHQDCIDWENPRIIRIFSQCKKRKIRLGFADLFSIVQFWWIPSQAYLTLREKSESAWKASVILKQNCSVCPYRLYSTMFYIKHKWQTSYRQSYISKEFRYPVRLSL